eukprot:NODE_664_length_1238_cov_232.347351_g477_i0.p1 GENE.NODE_664_length_1238_cov_232.347351_g477_i0~~NODE_664_length_1238_cov_232.347351_g477_i0.p1  ORF type:complete len:274 (-),score=65.83 NODE_664_length_1238_cov_232.347351_g477_i0:417-1130(-)
MSEEAAYHNLAAVGEVSKLYDDWHRLEHHYASIDERTGRYVAHRESAYISDVSLLKSTSNAYEQAITMEPGTAVYHFNLGNLAGGQRDFETAIFHYNNSMRLSPRNDEYRNALGVAYMELEKYEPAALHFLAAIKSAPKVPDYHFRRGYCLFKLKRYKEAAESFAKTAELEPENPNVYNWWATSLFEQGLYEEATQLFTKGAAMDPTANTHHISMDGTFYTLGHDAPAVTNFSSPLM